MLGQLKRSFAATHHSGTLRRDGESLRADLHFLSRVVRVSAPIRYRKDLALDIDFYPANAYALLRDVRNSYTPMRASTMDDRWMTLQEVAEYLQRSRDLTCPR